MRFPLRNAVKIHEIEFQAGKFREYLRRGGDPSRWLRSKGFFRADREAILALVHEPTVAPARALSFSVYPPLQEG